MENKLGRIEKIRFGMGGYQDAMFGVSVLLGGRSWGGWDFNGFWGLQIKPDRPYYKWDEARRDSEYAATMRWLAELMESAKVDDFEKLKGVPIEATFEGMALKSWRILTEVI